MTARYDLTAVLTAETVIVPGIRTDKTPPAEVDPHVLFIDDGDVLTSAGAATGLDPCIHMVRRDVGTAMNLRQHVT